VDGLDGFLEFLNYGAAGVLALAFLLMVFLLWKRGEKTDKAINGLVDKGETVDALLDVVRSNTAAMTCVKKAVEENSRIVERFDTDVSKKLDELGRDIRELRERV